MGASRATLTQLENAPRRQREDQLIAALKSKSTDQRPAVVIWGERIGVALVVLAVLGVIAVTSQVDRHEDFHKALVSLNNGDCIDRPAR